MSCGEIQVKSNLLNYWHFFSSFKNCVIDLQSKTKRIRFSTA